MANPYEDNNPFSSQHSDQDQVQVGGGNMQGAAQNVARQRLSSVGSSGRSAQGAKGGKGGKGGGGGAWRMIIKAALGGIGGGLTGASNASNNSNNPFGNGFGNANGQSPFSGGSQ